VIADDDDSTRELLVALLSMSPGLEVVGVCVDGVEVVETAVEHHADVIILDLHMPRLDGLAATRFLRAYLPDSFQVVFTSFPDTEAAERAAALDVPVLDKLAADDLVTLLEREARSASPKPVLADVDRLVLGALAGRNEDAVMVISPDLKVAFYNAAAADALRLPFPPVPDVDLNEVRQELAIVHRDGTPRPVETRPLTIAVKERRPVVDEICLVRDGGLDVYRSRAVPFFGDDGHFIGAAAYWTLLERLPLPAPAA
jgi:CheY-like chemotaxis protein